MKYRLSGSKEHPVDLADSDSDDGINFTGFGSMKLGPDSIKREKKPAVLNDDDEDEEDGDETTPEPHHNDSDDCLLITEAEYQDGQARSAQRATSSEVPQGFTQVRSAKLPNIDRLTEGMCVDFYDDDFMRVLAIFKHNVTQEVLLKGMPFRRSRSAHFFHRKLNEVVAVIQTDAGSSEPMMGTSLVLRPATEVRSIRQIVLTNHVYDAFSFREDGLRYCDSNGKILVDLVKDTAVLVCRWKLVEYWDFKKKTIVQRDFKQLRESEADPGKSMSDTAKRIAFLKSLSESPRDFTRKCDVTKRDEDTVEAGTSMSRSKRKANVVDLSSDDELEETTRKICKKTIREIFQQTKSGSFFSRRESTSIRTTTVNSGISATPARPRVGRPTGCVTKVWIYGDICAGAGGMARGAELAGFPVRFLLDRDSDCCRTLRRNWKREYVVEMDIFDFVAEVRAGRLSVNVDVLHISLPCQGWSPACTRDGPNTEEYRDALLSVQDILEVCKPRVVTFEQTSGLRSHHPLFFRAFIRIITSLNYSLSEKILNCAEYGNAQERMRLCIIAACTGQRVPPFPKPTHGHGPGLKPFVTIADCLREAQKQPLEPHMKVYSARDHAIPAYDPNIQLSQCITTGGGKGDVHPNGKHGFNMRQLACLQLFPVSHLFAVMGMKKLKTQIGNACPSSLGEAIFRSIKKTLDETELEDQRRGGFTVSSAIVLD